MFKNILFGLGSIGVVGGGGYMIYNATRSGNDKSVGTLNGEGAGESASQTKTVSDGEAGGTEKTKGEEGKGGETAGSESSSGSSTGGKK